MKTVKIKEPSVVVIDDTSFLENCGNNEIIVKVIVGGICGSDIGIYKGTNALATYPRIIGHEFGGIVYKIGKDVKNVKVGDHIAVDPVISCGGCYACNHGHHNVCSKLEVIGVHRDGGFRQYVTVPAKNAHKVSDKIDIGLLSMVEPFSIGMEINNRAAIGKGDKVLIMGSGPIGLCALQIAKARGASVIISDFVQTRLDKAIVMGADKIVNLTKDDLEKLVMEFTSNEGIPVVVDTACQVSTFELAVKLSSPAGRIVILGLKAEPSKIAMVDITKKELNIVGSRLSNNCFPEVIKGFEDGSLKPELIKTHEFNYLDAEKALKFNISNPQDVLKVVLRFND